MSSNLITADNGVSSGVTGITQSAGSACAVYWLKLSEHDDMFTQGYIGVSSDVEFRWRQHLKKKENPHLEHAINKYGEHSIIKQIVLIAERDYCLDIEKKLRPEPKIGWNIAIGGGNPPTDYGVKFQKGHVSWNTGVPVPEETRQKIANTLKGNIPWNKGKKGLQAAWNKGKPWSEEVRKQMSVTRKGRKPSEETRQKKREAMLGRKPYEMTDEIRAKISAGLKKRHQLLVEAKEQDNGINN